MGVIAVSSKGGGGEGGGETNDDDRKLLKQQSTSNSRHSNVTEVTTATTTSYGSRSNSNLSSTTSPQLESLEKRLGIKQQLLEDASETTTTENNNDLNSISTNSKQKRPSTTRRTSTIGASTGSTAGMEDSKAILHISSESIKLRTDSSVTNPNSIMTPLPQKLKQLGLIGRDKDVQTLRDCLYKYSWVNQQQKTSTTTSTKLQEQEQSNKEEVVVSCSPEQPLSDTPSSSSSDQEGLQPQQTNTANQQEQQHMGIVWVSGASGTGKTALVDYSLKEEVTSRGGLYVTGKFENTYLYNNEMNDSSCKSRNSSSMRSRQAPPKRSNSDRSSLSTSRQGPNTSTRPFAGIANACDDLCVQLLSLKHQSQQKYQHLLDTIQNQMDASKEIKLLVRLIPGLRPLLESLLVVVDSTTKGGEANNKNKNGSGNKVRSLALGLLEEVDKEASLQQSKDYFQFVFTKFMRIVAKIFPIVLVLDDLQWADQDSLELLENLILSNTNDNNNSDNNNNLMVVGCYRIDEVDRYEHPLNYLQKQVASRAAASSVTATTKNQSSTTTTTFEVTTIELQNLTVQDLNLLLCKLLEMEPQNHKTESLATICHKKTGGNAFFFVRFITMLWHERLLRFDIVAFRWEWEEDNIQKCSDASENVIKFLQTRMASLPETARHLLLFASCLGTEFDLPTMSLIMEDFYPGIDFQSDLQLCLEEGILEQCSTTTNTNTTTTHSVVVSSSRSRRSSYRWIHDKLMEAAQTLLGCNEKLQKLKYCVGAVLLKSRGGLQEGNNDLEEDVFVIANLLNEGAPTLSDTPTNMAELNLQAAKKAISLSSFRAASDYCEYGIALLPPENKWETHFDLTLQLHTTAATLYSSLGDIESMEEQCHEILSRSDVGILDKLKPYEHLMGSICYKGQVQEAMDMCLDVLKQLDITFPKSKIRMGIKIMLGLQKATKEVDSNCEKLGKLPLSQDAKHRGAQRILGIAMRYGHFLDSPILPLSPMKTIKGAMANGLTNDTPKSVAVIGMITGAFVGDIQAGSKYGRLALELLDKLPAKRRMFPEASMIAYSYVLHNTQPVHEMMRPLLQVYDVALEYGSSEYALWGIYNYLLIAFRSGKAIGAIETDARAYTEQMAYAKIERPLTMARILWQMIMNLMSFPDTRPLVMTGEAMDEVDFVGKNKADSMYYTTFQAFQNITFAIFGRHELGAKLSLSKAEMLSCFPGSPLIVIDVFYRAVSLFAMARETKKWKYARAAKKLRAKIDGWCKQGNPNCLHLSSFLSAESAALKGQKEEAERLYDTAIVTASKLGFIQDAAYASERLGELFEYDLKDASSASFRYQEAIRLYRDWGAAAKVKDLTNTKSALLNLGQVRTSDHPDQIYVELVNDDLHKQVESL